MQLRDICRRRSFKTEYVLFGLQLAPKIFLRRWNMMCQKTIFGILKPSLQSSMFFRLYTLKVRSEIKLRRQLLDHSEKRLGIVGN